MDKANNIMVHGHRGYRGMYPENTTVGFIAALNAGVHALEMDVVLTSENTILVSHDPFMHHEICLKPDSTDILEAEQEMFNIFKMTVPQVQAFIIGGKPHPRFPKQQPVYANKPTLKELVDAVKQYQADKSIGSSNFIYNIEIKSQPSWDGVFQPEPKQYINKFLEEFLKLGIENQTIIQSFDPRILEELHKKQPQLKLVYLSEDSTKTAIQKLGELSFKPFGYSPNFSMVNQELVQYCKQEELELIVWTVNEEKDIQRMIDMGLEHIITDYPELALTLIQKKSKT